jgi:integrase
MTPLNGFWSYQAKVCLKDYDLHPTFAMSYLRKVGDLLSLQRIMGHTDLAMTKRYVAYTLGDIKEQHAHASPV